MVVVDGGRLGGCVQWRTLAIIVGGAKRYEMGVEGANSNYFAFCMVKNDKY
jgi:hypothetical protein